MAARMAASRPQKRKAVDPLDAACPIPKHARIENSSDRDQDREGAYENDGISYSRSGSLAPSLPLTAPSIVETSQTSRSSRPKNIFCEVAGCGKGFDRPARLEIHMRSHTNDRPYVCEAEGCGKTFLRNEHLKRHVLDKHSEERSHVCTHVISITAGKEVHCGKSFTTATRLRRHVAAHEAKEETTCSFAGCGKVFRKQETLQRHIKTDHLGEKPFKCGHVDAGNDGQAVECQETFANSKQLKTHEARDHSGPRYWCEICSPEANNTELAINGSDLVSELGERIGFAAYADLQLHIKTVHPPTCPEPGCGKQCESNRALKAHIDIAHSALDARQTHICDWEGCGRGFTKAGNLKVHVQSVHMKTRNFVCGEFDLSGSVKVEGWNGQGCGSAFGTKANLEGHVRTRHLGMPSTIRPSRLQKKLEKASEGTLTPADSAMDVDEVYTPVDYKPVVKKGGRKAMSMLTGYGYEQNRPYGCLVMGCQQRFVREYDLSEHLELTHGWQVEDVEDALVARMSLGDGQVVNRVMEQKEEEELRRGLTAALAGQDNPLSQMHDARWVETSDQMFDAGFDAQQPDMNSMPIDPALAAS